MSKCLKCYKELNNGEQGYHKSCRKKFFGREEVPELLYTMDDIEKMGKILVSERITVTGVQPKLSVDFKKTGKADKITIVGFGGKYILKIPVAKYPYLPEYEDVTMHLAEASGIKTAEHSLIKTESGELAYITKRMDRAKKEKIHMEDMCQISERLTEHKYKGSYEQIGKKIHQYSTVSGLDLLNFAEVVLFCFITGNSDMHLKNFSLIETGNNIRLSPAYDLVPGSILLKEDTEETALTLDGKKRNLSYNNFVNFFKKISINEKVIDTLFKKYYELFGVYSDIIDACFLPAECKNDYKDLIESRMKRLQLI